MSLGDRAIGSEGRCTNYTGTDRNTTKKMANCHVSTKSPETPSEGEKTVERINIDISCSIQLKASGVPSCTDSPQRYIFFENSEPI